VDEEIGVKFFYFVDWCVLVKVENCVKKWRREMEGLIEGWACIGALLLKMISKSFSFYYYEENFL
jgi:hypothetical protein